MQNVRFIMRSMACFNVSCTDRNAVNTDGPKKKERKRVGRGKNGAFTPIFKNDRSAPPYFKIGAKWTYTLSVLDCIALSRFFFFFRVTTRHERYFCLGDWLIDVSGKKWPLLAILLGLCMLISSLVATLSKRKKFRTVTDRSPSICLRAPFIPQIYRKFDFVTYRICIIHGESGMSSNKIFRRLSK